MLVKLGMLVIVVCVIREMRARWLEKGLGADEAGQQEHDLQSWLIARMCADDLALDECRELMELCRYVDARYRKYFPYLKPEILSEGTLTRFMTRNFANEERVH